MATIVARILDGDHPVIRRDDNYIVFDNKIHVWLLLARESETEGDLKSIGVIEVDDEDWAEIEPDLRELGWTITVEDSVPFADVPYHQRFGTSAFPRLDSPGKWLRDVNDTRLNDHDSTDPSLEHS